MELQMAHQPTSCGRRTVASAMAALFPDAAACAMACAAAAVFPLATALEMAVAEADAWRRERRTEVARREESSGTTAAPAAWGGWVPVAGVGWVSSSLELA